MRTPRTLTLLACAALALTACSGANANTAPQTSATTATGVAPSVIAEPSATPSGSATPNLAADLARRANAMIDEAEFTGIGTLTMTSDGALSIQGFTADGPAMWTAEPDQDPSHVGGPDMARQLILEVDVDPDALDLEAMAERTAAASADCTTATLHAEATPGGKLWQWLTCDTAYVADSTMIDSSEFPDTKTITTATEWDEAVALLRPLLEADPTHIRATSNENPMPFALTATQRQRVDGTTCWDTVSLPSQAEASNRAPMVYGCTTVHPVFESWGATGEPLPLDKLNGAFFTDLEPKILAERDADATKRFHIDYYLISDTELGHQVTHDDARWSGSTKLPE